MPRPAADAAPSSSRAPPPLSLTGILLESSSLLDGVSSVATAAYAIHDGAGKAPQLPFSGTYPVPLSGASSSAFGASLGDSGAGSLVVLLGISALAAGLLISSREFLRPNSAYGLIGNQPG